MDGDKPVPFNPMTTEKGRVFMTATGALLRLCLDQRLRDNRAGLNTAGYVSGYRGSPLGHVDAEFWAHADLVKAHHIHYQAGVNEDLAATAIWGSQQINLYPGAKYDGVFGLWYGKGPGVDRSGDVFRHANLAGSADKGGVLVVCGDDPACTSSTVPSQSDYALIDAMIPLLAPADVQEILDYGHLGWQMSRYSGCWVGLKTLTENMDSAGTVLVDHDRLSFREPEIDTRPDDGLSIRWPDPPLVQEKRLHREKVKAALRYARVNGVNRQVFDGGDNPKTGIITAGKSYPALKAVLKNFGLQSEDDFDRFGLRIFKVGLVWPLDDKAIRAFAGGLDHIIVVEEKRAVIEPQLKDILYPLPDDQRPKVVGKKDEAGNWLFPSETELTQKLIAKALARYLPESGSIKAHLSFLEGKDSLAAKPIEAPKRTPYFCAGCPHNISTTVPEGMRAAAGIGCHYLAVLMDRESTCHTHMGAEGANWLGQAPFTETPHIFANIGDGTYFHSGLMAIRAAVASKVNMTYKILYNDAVAMTGGQPMDGPLDVAMITRQTRAEGAGDIAIVSETPEIYNNTKDLAPGTKIFGRKDFDRVQRDLATKTGVTILIFDQTCAAEKRRRRKKGELADPDRRPFINALVCDGCGDCGVKSNCVAIQPLETDQGRKRRIDQTACNKDFTCTDGFCPSFVTVEGAKLKAKTTNLDNRPRQPLPEPKIPVCKDSYGIMVVGVGGTGVLTVGSLLGRAANIEGKAVSVLDQAGLAQKNGAVYCHIHIAKDEDKLTSQRIGPGAADLMLGYDILTAGSPPMLETLKQGKSSAIINTQQTMTGAFARNPDQQIPADAILAAIGRECGGDNLYPLNASAITAGLFGHAQTTNIFLIGFAWQKGLIPLGEQSIIRAMAESKLPDKANNEAFYQGRLAATDPAVVLAFEPKSPEAETLDDLIERLAEDLTAYQSARYARKFTDPIDKMRKMETATLDGAEALTRTAARNLHKLMAYKDEYEVARLFTDGRFEQELNQTFEQGYRLKFHMAPPLLAHQNKTTGEPEKQTLGPWIMGGMKHLTRLKGLRGTPLDLFGYSKDRRYDRTLLKDYLCILEKITANLTPDNHTKGIELASYPETIRGFGPVRQKNTDAAKVRKNQRLSEFLNETNCQKAAE